MMRHCSSIENKASKLDFESENDRSITNIAKARYSKTVHGLGTDDFPQEKKPPSHH